MKTVSVVVACYNEEGNIGALYDSVTEVFKTKLPEYNYQILFMDNDSKDNTRPLIKELCEKLVGCECSREAVCHRLNEIALCRYIHSATADEIAELLV